MKRLAVESDVCIVGSGIGMIVVSLVRVLIRASDAPQELPTQRTSAFLSVPMRRGPCDQGRGLLKLSSLKLS